MLDPSLHDYFPSPSTSLEDCPTTKFDTANQYQISNAQHSYRKNLKVQRLEMHKYKVLTTNHTPSSRPGSTKLVSGPPPWACFFRGYDLFRSQYCCVLLVGSDVLSFNRQAHEFKRRISCLTNAMQLAAARCLMHPNTNPIILLHTGEAKIV